MKDRTNKEKPQLGRTLEGVALMQRWLQGLYEDEYPKNPLMFAIKAQGPLDQMRDLLDDIEWLMEDMIPPHLREQDAPPEAVAAREAA